MIGVIPRLLAPTLREALADTPVVYLQGPRQTGKSTLAQSLDEGRRYVSLDNAAARAAAMADPEGFVAALGGPVAIDEAQRAPDLMLAVKVAVDLDRTPGRFLLTGSANVLALPRVSESLAGRIDVQTLWPLAEAELGQVAGPTFVDRVFAADFALPPTANVDPSEDVLARMRRGGYPEARERANDRRRDAWFESYVATLVQRDLRELANLEHLAEAPRLLALLASRCGSLINAADLARSMKFPQSTLRRYVGLLEALFLVRPLPAWSSSRGKRLVKSPKLMFPDGGLLAHLTGLPPDAAVSDRTAFGPQLENLAFTEVLKQLGWSDTPATLHHYRDERGREVDLVLEDRRGRVAGVEVKAAATVTAGDLKGLRELREAAGGKWVRGVVLHLGREAIAFEPDLLAIPLPSLWSD